MTTEERLPGLVGELADRSVRVTTRRVVLVVLVMQALVLGIVATERLGVELPVLRQVITVVYLSFVPGYLLLRILGIEDAGWTETLLYAVGLSLVALMALGVIANFLLQGVGVAAPISELPLVLSLGVAVCGLTALYATRVTEHNRVDIPLRRLSSPAVLGLTLVPFLGIFGALMLTRLGNNLLLLCLYAVLLAIPVLVAMDRVPSWLFPYLVWIVAISLLLQNTLTGQFLAWGDSPKEARLALNVVQTGYWQPALAPGYGSKYTMLRIVILHPIYALVTDLKFVWEFKLVHPFIFSLTPVALYRTYQQYTETRTAFFSVYLFMSLFSFFIVLSRNTRTATALFFISLFLLLVATDKIRLSQRKALAITFVGGVVVSHYGVSYIFLFILTAVLLLKPVLTWLSPRLSDETPLVSRSFVVLYLAMLFSWYMYASPSSKAFRLLTGFALSFVDRLTTEFFASPESASASTRYVSTEFASTTLEVLKLFNVLVGGVIVVGLAFTYWRLVTDREIEFDAEFLAYATVALAVFGITFLPVERFNTARTYPTTLLFYAPFFVVGIREPLRVVRRYVSRFDVTSVYRLTAVVLVVFLALNVGFVSSVFTHEYSTNALVEKDRIMDDGFPAEKSYFYKQYPTVYGVRGTQWLQTTGRNNSTLYLSNWPGGLQGAVGYESLSQQSADLPYFRHTLIQREMLTNGTRLGRGYLFFNAFNHPRLGNVIRHPTGHFGFAFSKTDQSRSAWRQKNRIYANTGTRVYYSARTANVSTDRRRNHSG